MFPELCEGLDPISATNEAILPTEFCSPLPTRLP